MHSMNLNGGKNRKCHQYLSMFQCARRGCGCEVYMAGCRRVSEEKGILITHWSFFQCLFSTPAWLALIRSMAMIFSSRVRNRAVAGESGK